MKLIINADDFGMTKSINQAIFELVELGSISSTSVMANMPYAKEITKLLPYSKVSIGLHVNITQGRPVAPVENVPTLVNLDGEFYSKDLLLERISKKLVSYLDVQKEIVAQYSFLQGLIGNRLLHFDSHQGSTRIPLVYESLQLLAQQEKKKFGIRVHAKYYLHNSIQPPQISKPSLFPLTISSLRRVLIEYRLRTIRNKWRKQFNTPEGMLFNNKHNTLLILSDLLNLSIPIRDNGTYEISCHPSIDTSELENTVMTNSRVAEYELLKSRSFIDSKKNFELVNYYGLK